MRLTSPNRNLPSICLAIYGCAQLERIADFINQLPQNYNEAGIVFTRGQIAGQYAFEQVKLDRKGYDSRRLLRCLSFLADAGAVFDADEALLHADDLINNYTADFGHDEDGEATFRIKAQSFRLKKYDCHALWSRIRQSELEVIKISRENLCSEDDSEEFSAAESSDSLDFRLTARLIDLQGEPLASVQQYFTVNGNAISVEDFIDFDFTDYPNFHDESGTTAQLIDEVTDKFMSRSVQAVRQYFIEQNLRVPEYSEHLGKEYLITTSTFSLNN